MQEVLTKLVDNMPLDELADYIVEKHHHYIANKSPVIIAHLEQLAALCGDKYPNLAKITDLFQQSADSLARHTRKEEMILFPFIKKMTEIKEQGTHLPAVPFGTVNNPVNMMMHEHDEELAHFAQIRQLATHYESPPDMGDLGQLTFGLLDEFEQDLQLHIQLENTVLFPKAIQLESELPK